ncbi:hypothetical protein [Frankia sp. EAN1pec]|uniref:hypothetical protein n=1 Tax=Parafrankia sp. (strain EAN1pec) TaxID=298653 RepID=UPI0018DD3300
MDLVTDVSGDRAVDHSVHGDLLGRGGFDRRVAAWSVFPFPAFWSVASGDGVCQPGGRPVKMFHGPEIVNGEDRIHVGSWKICERAEESPVDTPLSARRMLTEPGGNTRISGRQGW